MFKNSVYKFKHKKGLEKIVHFNICLKYHASRMSCFGGTVKIDVKQGNTEKWLKTAFFSWRKHYISWLTASIEKYCMLLPIFRIIYGK